MSEIDVTQLKQMIQQDWPGSPSEKAQKYVDQFFQQTLTGTGIKGKVEGNHGTYTVTIGMKKGSLTSACSCYVGGDGDCHHCEALAITFLNSPESFKKVKPRSRKRVRTLDELHTYLQSVTLESLLKELKSEGITQKAFAESIGMTSRHLSAIKSSELRNRFYHELGATKLACLWVKEHCKPNRK